MCYHIIKTDFWERCVQWLQPASSSAGEICLGKYSTPVHTYVTRVIWVQAGWDGRGQALSTCLWRYAFRQLRASAHHPRGWWGPALPTTRTKKDWSQQSCQLSRAFLAVMRDFGWVPPYVHTALPQTTDQTSSRLIWQFDGPEIGNQQWLIPTIVWDGARIGQWEQHVQHGYSIRELVQAMNVLVDSSQQLTYHPVWRQVSCFRGKALEEDNL